MPAERKEAVPVRVQLSRKKGWKMPPNTVKVTRPSKWGNPFVVTDKVRPGTEFKGAAYGCIAVPTVEDAVECFREMMDCAGDHADDLRASLHELRGKNLACWCKIVDQHGNAVPCHADVLLELANRPLDGEP